LAPISGPIVVRGAKSGDVVAIHLIELSPFGSGKSAILPDFGVLRREFLETVALSSPVRDGRAWFGGRIPLPLNPNLGTISTTPPEGYKPSYAGAYGGDFDQKDAGQGSRVYLPVLVEDALAFFGALADQAALKFARGVRRIARRAWSPSFPAMANLRQLS
jgi:amidase